jgi:hypothetical protein
MKKCGTATRICNLAQRKKKGEQICSPLLIPLTLLASMRGGGR